MNRIKNWLRLRTRQPEREKEIDSNQFGSKILFEELFLDDVTDDSQIYLYRKEVRGDGNVFRPVRATINQLREWFFPPCFDEGNATTTYLPENEYDEGDATNIIPSLDWDEGSANFIAYACDLGATTPSTPTTSAPIVTISSDTTLSEARYYRITGGTMFTITLASGVFNALTPFELTIKNVSGVTITINRSGSDTFYSTTGAVTTFDLADGEWANLLATTTSNYDLER